MVEAWNTIAILIMIPGQACTPTNTLTRMMSTPVAHKTLDLVPMRRSALLRDRAVDIDRRGAQFSAVPVDRTRDRAAVLALVDECHCGLISPVADVFALHM